MSTLELIAALALALTQNDLVTVARILEALDTRLEPHEVGELLATLERGIAEDGGADQRTRGATAAEVNGESASQRHNRSPHRHAQAPQERM